VGTCRVREDEDEIVGCLRTWACMLCSVTTDVETWSPYEICEQLQFKTRAEARQGICNIRSQSTRSECREK
jgi:hypothetical protein